MSKRKVKVGDTIIFTTWHLRAGVFKRQTRKVTYVDQDRGIVGVRFLGYNPFYLDQRGDKIHKIIKAPKK